MISCFIPVSFQPNVASPSPAGPCLSQSYPAYLVIPSGLMLSLSLLNCQSGTWHMCSCVRWSCADGGRQRRGRLSSAHLQIPSQTPLLAVVIHRQYLQGGNLITSRKVPFPLRYFPQKKRPSVAAQVKTTAQCVQLIWEITFYQHAKSCN